jgi:PIN domain nuclease of toxin-antitoxin system
LRVLLDTHVWLWIQVEPERIQPSVLAVLEDPATHVFLSTVSVWEIVVKHGVGRLTLPEPPAEYVPERLGTSGVELLPVNLAHALGVASLPHHHGDPFDRMLVAQATTEGLALVTADRLLEPYDVELISAR